MCSVGSGAITVALGDFAINNATGGYSGSRIGGGAQGGAVYISRSVSHLRCSWFPAPVVGVWRGGQDLHSGAEGVLRPRDVA